jgi:hypothetical protein
MVAVAGCGSSGDSAADARSSVESAVRRVLTGDGPALCQRGMTSRFLDQNYGGDGDDPLEQCQFDAELPGDPFARAVDFTSTRVEGGHAVATVSVSGGQGDGSIVRIEVVRVGDEWKLDRYADIQIDRARFDAATRRNVVKQGATAGEARCIVQRLRRFYETDELEHAIVAGKTDEFSAAEVVCLGRRTLVKEFALALRTGAPDEIPDQIVDCISRRLTDSASTNLLRAIFAAEDKLSGYINRAATAAAKACRKDAEAGLLPSPAAS